MRPLPANRYDREVFKERLRNVDYNYLYGLHNLKDSWDFLYGKIAPLIDHMCPLVTSKYDVSRPPWITRELMELAANRDKAMTLAKKKTHCKRYS